MAPRVDPPLWLTFAGARPVLGVGWLAWAAGTAVFAWATAGPFAAAAGALPVFVVGWLLARHLPDPLACLRRFHVDDRELVVMGPGRRVRRIEWDEIESVTQQRATLTLRGRRSVRLPLANLRDAGAWGAILVRVVPVVAQGLWGRLERGRVRLRPPLDPPASSLAWWAWGPALATCGVIGDPTSALLVGLVALGERLFAWVAALRHEVHLHGRGVGLGGRRREFLAWSDVMVLHAADGLGLARPGHEPVLVPATLRDFWAVAPVIELRAQLGAEVPGEVCFRARVDGGALAVVGEVEAPH